MKSNPIIFQSRKVELTKKLANLRQETQQEKFHQELSIVRDKGKGRVNKYAFLVFIWHYFDLLLSLNHSKWVITFRFIYSWNQV